VVALRMIAPIVVAIVINWNTIFWNTDLKENNGLTRIFFCFFI
jgi:hypothetical protein